MAALLFLIGLALVPVLIVWGMIQLFRWIMKRITGFDIYIAPDNHFDMYRKMKALWDYDPLDYSSTDIRKVRKSQHTPHYDRLIADEARAAQAYARLSETPIAESREPVPLAQLLEDEV